MVRHGVIETSTNFTQMLFTLDSLTRKDGELVKVKGFEANKQSVA